MNVTARRIFGSALAIFTFLYAFNIITKVLSGTDSPTMLIFAVFMVIIGLVGVGVALNFNGILNNQPKPKTPTKPAGPLTRVGGIIFLILGVLEFIVNFSKIITPHASLLDIAGDLLIPVVLVVFGIGMMKRK
ncbi:MAG: hypothetical protein M1142_04315 [Patescibacteria group bacterium]|nr:hypothetical protein [Patescibacteria group bacterium]